MCDSFAIVYSIYCRVATLAARWHAVDQPNAYKMRSVISLVRNIFTIDNPEFEKHITDIYPAELQLNKANTSDKESSFLD